MAVFPAQLPGLGWSVVRRARFGTKTQTADNRRETRIPAWTYPEWRWTLTWNVLRDDRNIPANQTPTAPYHELKTIEGFFLQRRGSYEAFWFDDPTDRLIDGTSDGVRQTIIASSPAGVTDYRVVRARGGFVEPVGAINAMTLYDDGVVVAGGNYQINVPYDGWIRFSGAPGAGSVLKWAGTFYHKVRFFEDAVDFDQFMYDLYQLRTVRLVSVSE